MLRNQRDIWDLDFAQSADQAVECLLASPFDAIVSDVTMPGKTGLDLLEIIQNTEAIQNVPVVILTGNAQADLKRRALDLGATDLLNKPVTQEDLIARLQSVLRLKGYQDALLAQNEILEERVKERTLELERSRRDIIWRLAKAGEFRDVETGEHVIRVACCSRILARAAGLNPVTVESIFLTSPLHDIGKIGVPDGILLKPGRFTPEERVVMERHCEIGASILLEEPKGIELFLECPIDCGDNDRLVDPLRKMAVSIALSHHEKWDGSGYPKQLAGDDIPMAARIVAFADTYDALRSERPYKRAISMQDTVDIMRKEAGSHYDPDLFVVFETVVDEFEDVLHLSLPHDEEHKLNQA